MKKNYFDNRFMGKDKQLLKKELIDLVTNI